MQNNINTSVERIIAKIDNDFNPDNSDWIPRVGAWCIDAMSQLDVLRTQRSRKKLIVKDGIAYSECPLNNEYLKVFDSDGCEIKKATASECCGNSPSTGESTSETSGLINKVTPNTVNIVNTGKDEDVVVGETINGYPARYNIHMIKKQQPISKNYVIVDCNKLEINFESNFIYIETDVIETAYSDIYGCELPVIPNNGLLIEAIAYYCIYKMICRGYKHPVFNLHASQYGTNPYHEWNVLKDQAKRSVINKSFDENNASKLFRSNLFIDIFDPRN